MCLLQIAHRYGLGNVYRHGGFISFYQRGLNAGTTTQVLEMICMKIERGVKERGINLNLNHKE